MEFIELRNRGWKIYKILSTTESELVITNKESTSETISKTDSRLSPFRTNTEMLEGSEELLNNVNFMDFAQIQQELDFYLLYPNQENRFLIQVSGIIFYAFHQMAILDYSQYQEYKPQFCQICLKILKAAEKLVLTNSYKFREKYESSESGQYFCCVGWQELGKMIEWIFKGADSFNAPGLDMLAEEGFFKRLSLSINEDFLKKFFERTCMRMIYLFDGLFVHFLRKPNPFFLTMFMKFCSGLNSKECRTFDIEKTKKLLLNVVAPDHINGIMADICSNLFLKSEKLVQKIEIARFLSYSNELKMPQDQCETYLSVIFTHETLLEASKHILKHFLGNNGLNANVFKKMFLKVNYDVTLHAYFRTFNQLVQDMNKSVAKVYLSQMIESKIAEKNQYLKEAAKIMAGISKHRDFIMSIIGDDLLLIEILPQEDSLKLETQILQKFLNLNQKDEKVVEIVLKLVQNRDMLVIKELEKMFDISHLIVNQLNFNHEPQTLEKIRKILEYFFSYSLAGANTIENILHNMEVLSKLQELLCYWLENNILNAYYDKFKIFFNKIENVLGIPKAFLIIFKKICNAQCFKKTVLYFNNVDFELFNQANLAYLMLNDEDLSCDYLQIITRFLLCSCENYYLNHIKNYYETNFQSYKTKIDRLMIEFTGINTRVPFEIKQKSYKIKTEKKIKTIQSPYEYQTDEFFIDICERFKKNPQVLNEEKTESGELILSFNDLQPCVYNFNQLFLKSELWFNIDKQYYKYIPRLIELITKNNIKENNFLQYLDYIKTLNRNNLFNFDTNKFKEFYEVLKNFPIINQKIFNFLHQVPNFLSDPNLKSVAFSCFLCISVASEEELDIDHDLIQNYDEFDIRIEEEYQLTAYFESFLNFKEKSLLKISSFIKPYLIYNPKTDLRKSRNLELYSLFLRGSLDSTLKSYLFKFLESKNYIYIATVIDSILLSKEASNYFFISIQKVIQQNSEFSNMDLYNYLHALRSLECCSSKIEATLLSEWLFDQAKIKFKYEKTRRLGFEILATKIKQTVNEYQKNYEKRMDQSITQILQNIFKFSTTIDLCHLERYKKYSKGFHLGLKSLKNFGNFCYINSSLQLLNGIQPLRQKLIFLRTDCQSLNSLSYILAKLNYSNLSTVSSKRLLKNFIYKDGNLNLFVQDDASEFISSLISRVDMLGAPYLLEDIQINFSLNIVCFDCKQNYRSIGQTYMIHMDIDGVDSVSNYFQIDGPCIKSDENFCPKCSSIQVTAQKSLNNSPGFLIISLNRFKIDLNTSSTVKVNDYCELKYFITVNEQEYELIGLISHYGNSNAGHYITYMKQNQLWVELDDEKLAYFDVQSFNLNDLFNPNLIKNSKQTKGTPYILLYKLKSSQNEIKVFNNSAQLIPEIFHKNRKIFESFLYFNEGCNFLIIKLIEYKVYPKIFLNFLFRVGLFLDLSESEIFNFSIIFQKTFKLDLKDAQGPRESFSRTGYDLNTEMIEYINLNIEEFICRLEFVKSPNLIHFIPKFLSIFLMHHTDKKFESSIIQRIIRYISSFDYRNYNFNTVIELLAILLKNKTDKNEVVSYSYKLLNYFIYYRLENIEYPEKLQPRKTIYSTSFIPFFDFLSSVDDLNIVHQLFSNNLEALEKAICSANEHETLQRYQVLITEKLKSLKNLLESSQISGLQVKKTFASESKVIRNNSLHNLRGHTSQENPNQVSSSIKRFKKSQD